VFRLREEVRGDVRGISAGVRHDHHLRWSGRQIDATFAEDLELGRGYPGVAGANDSIDRLDARFGQAVRQPPTACAPPATMNSSTPTSAAARAVSG